MGHQLPLSRCPYCCVLSRLRRTGCRRPTCTYVPIGIEPLLVNRSALPGFLVSSRPAPRAAWPPSDLLPGAAPACPGSFELDQGLVHRCALLRENGPALELLRRRIFATASRPIINGFFVLAGLRLWSPFPSLAPQVAVTRVSRRRLHLKDALLLLQDRHCWPRQAGLALSAAAYLFVKKNKAAVFATSSWTAMYIY